MSSIPDVSNHPLLTGKTELSLGFYQKLLEAFTAIGPVQLHPTKTMIGIRNSTHTIAWVTQVGKNFVHLVLPFKQSYPDNLCFQKIAQVPGSNQFNHHFRMYSANDINEEVKEFFALAYGGK